MTIVDIIVGYLIGIPLLFAATLGGHWLGRRAADLAADWLAQHGREGSRIRAWAVRRNVRRQLADPATTEAILAQSSNLRWAFVGDWRARRNYYAHQQHGGRQP